MCSWNAKPEGFTAAFGHPTPATETYIRRMRISWHRLQQESRDSNGGYSTEMNNRLGPRLVRWVSVACLVVAGLFYLQFGLQALAHHVPQGILSLVGAAALLWGAARRWRGTIASGVVLFGTLPILVLHAVVTLEDPGELPFLLGSIPVPLLATLFLLGSRQGFGKRRAGVDRGSTTTFSDT